MESKCKHTASMGSSGGGGGGIGRLVAWGGALAVASLVAAFAVKRNRKSDADKKEDHGSRELPVFLVLATSTPQGNSCCNSCGSKQTDSCDLICNESFNLEENSAAIINGGDENSTCSSHQDVVGNDDKSKEVIEDLDCTSNEVPEGEKSIKNGSVDLQYVEMIKVQVEEAIEAEIMSSAEKNSDGGEEGEERREEDVDDSTKDCNMSKDTESGNLHNEKVESYDVEQLPLQLLGDSSPCQGGEKDSGEEFPLMERIEIINAERSTVENTCMHSVEDRDNANKEEEKEQDEEVENDDNEECVTNKGNVNKEEEKEQDEEEENDDNEECVTIEGKNTYEGTRNSSSESSAEAIWSVELVEPLSLDPKSSVTDMQISGESIVEEGGSIKTECNQLSNSNTNNILNTRENYDTTENWVLCEMEKSSKVTSVSQQTAHPTKGKIWVCSALVLGLVLLLFFNHHIASSYNLLNRWNYLFNEI